MTMARGEYGLARRQVAVQGDTHIRAAIRRDMRRIQERWERIPSESRSVIKGVGFGVAALAVAATVVYVVRR